VDPSSIRVASSKVYSEDHLLIQRARDAALTCTYAPAIKDGKRVPVRVLKRFAFSGRSD
jgi:hypothetical protein